MSFTKYFLVALVLAAAILMSGCTRSGALETNELTIHNASNNVTISTPRTTGTITIPVGGTFTVKVIKRHEIASDATTTDVTATATYIFNPNGIATIASDGDITGMAVGTTVMEARLPSENLGLDVDHCFLNIVVTP